MREDASCIDDCQCAARVAATADAQGVAVPDTPEVLFVCVHNAGRLVGAARCLGGRSAWLAPDQPGAATPPTREG